LSKEKSNPRVIMTRLQLFSSAGIGRAALPRIIYYWANYRDFHVALRSAVIFGFHPDHQEFQSAELWVEPDFLAPTQKANATKLFAMVALHELIKSNYNELTDFSRLPELIRTASEPIQPS
jgi:hypothetical protein